MPTERPKRSPRRKAGARRSAARPRRGGSKQPSLPEVRIGRTVPQGIAPALYAPIALGLERRPELAKRMRGRVVFRFSEDFPPVKVAFAARSIVIEDGDLRTPDLVVEGGLSDVIHLATAPHVRGVPNPGRARGRRALGRLARGQVTVAGDGRLARGLLSLMAIEA